MLKVPRDIIKTQRVKIPTGLKCNFKCRFCYYYDYLHAKNPPTRVIKDFLEIAKSEGIKDIDFSGGEPTLRPDFPEIVSYAKDLGFRRICVITNGFLMGNEEYTNKLVKAGLNDVLFSLHGCNKEIHEYLTQIPKSFDRIISAIKITKDLGIRFRFNTTINKINYKELPEFTKLYLKFEPKAMNFIFFNPYYSDNKQTIEMACKFSEAIPLVKDSIDELKSKIDKITVRYVPFCFMEGYEKYVCNHRQTQYDCDEWNRLILARFEGINPFKHLLFKFTRFAAGPFKKTQTFNHFLSEAMYYNVMLTRYTMPNECSNCKFKFVCDGLKKGYAKVFSDKELKHVEGKPITNSMLFRKNYGNYGGNC